MMQRIRWASARHMLFFEVLLSDEAGRNGWHWRCGPAIVLCRNDTPAQDLTCIERDDGVLAEGV